MGFCGTLYYPLKVFLKNLRLYVQYKWGLSLHSIFNIETLKCRRLSLASFNRFLMPILLAMYADMFSSLADNLSNRCRSQVFIFLTFL